MTRSWLVAGAAIAALAVSACSPVSNGPATSSASAKQTSYAELWEQLVTEAELDQISGYELTSQAETKIVAATVLSGTTSTTYRLIDGAGVSSVVNQGSLIPIGPTVSASQVDISGISAKATIDGCEAPAVQVVTTLAGALGSYQTCGSDVVADSVTIADQPIATTFDASVRESWDGLVSYLTAVSPQQLKIGVAQGVLTSINTPQTALSDGSACAPVLGIGSPTTATMPFAVSCGEAPSGEVFNLADFDLNAIWDLVNKATNNDPAALATVSITSPEAGKITLAMTSNNGTAPLTEDIASN